MNGGEVEATVDAIATAVAACPLVADLHAGPYGTAATLLPGRKVIGVQISRTEVSVHVTARYPAEMVLVAEQARAAVTPLSGGLPVSVTIEDLATPDDTARPADPAVRRSGAAKES